VIRIIKIKKEENSMNSQLSVKAVPFMGDELMVAKDEETGKIFAGVKWICDGFGLSEGQAKSERLRIQNDVVLKRGGRNIVLPTKGGNQEVQCIEIDFIPLWLAKITITPTMQRTSGGCRQACPVSAQSKRRSCSGIYSAAKTDVNSRFSGIYGQSNS
jgi:hypothetical protein